jgi:AcrR family transcriptional regulator
MARRLPRDERRAQLVELGVELLRTRSLDQLALEDVAAAAGISRALPFHYFPTRRDFLLAVVEASAGGLLDAVDADPSLPPLERLHAGLEGYIDYIAQNPAAYIALMRGAAGADNALVAVFDRTRDAIVDRILAGLEATDERLLRLAIRGWVGMVEEAAVSWLRDHPVDRDDLLWLLDEALVRIVTALSEHRPAIARG